MSTQGIAVAYTRRSTDGQEHSIPDQIKAIQKYADDKGYQIIRWYTDDAISGDDTKKRLGFQQMLADAQQYRDHSVVICWDQSRFGRFSPQEAGHWTYLFSEAGVSLVTVDKGLIDWNDFTGWLTYGVNQHSKHDFLRQLSKDVARGQLEAAQKGSWLGLPPYGYRIEGMKKNKRLVVGDVGKVKIVQRVFREFVEDGRTMADIARRLHEDGIVPPGKGRPWRYDSVRCILENPAYCGDYVSGRFSYGKYNSIHGEQAKRTSGRKGVKKNPESKWIVRRDNHEPIIDRDTFERVQAILKKGKTDRSRFTPETNPFLLAGLMRCGTCGSPMWGDTVKGRRFYRCGNWQGRGWECKNRKGKKEEENVIECEGTKVREDMILSSIADHLYDEFLSLDGVQLARKANRRELQPSDVPEGFAKVKKLVAPPKQLAGDRKRMEKQVKELSAQLDKARRNLVLLDAEYIPDAQAEIRRLQTERDELELELRKRPPTEADINAEATAVLRSLYWLAMLFDCAAEEVSDPDGSEREGPVLLGAGRSLNLRKYLRHIASITIHSRKEGKGTATRHVFERGEITLYGVGANTGKVNLLNRVS
ncbi:MAG: recombinase family protein [Planctomycetia bacterium]|nr:recombinase family protein [Planctomycetia bacterium]